jgi:glycosyltransferase involved in cell wall biosynthesis
LTELRILVLAPESNPESVSNPAIGYYQAEALARIHEVTLALHAVNEAAVRRGGARFHAIEPVPVPIVDPVYDWSVRRIFKHDYGRMTLTALLYPRQVFFELCAWRQLRNRISSGAFDVVLRLLPYNRVLPSPFAWLLRKGPIPFVAGPVSGGLPWTKGFSQLDRQKKEPGHWVWNLRRVADYLPFARSTYEKAAAIIVGSSHTYSTLAAHREKLFFMPTEIGINPELFKHVPDRRPGNDGKLELIYVGRLVSFKACDIALKGAAELLRSGAARFTIIGDGPQREAFQQLADSLGVATAVSFRGPLPHPETLKALATADVLVFPSLREIGGGVVFEALTAGAVPVVADFGGPGDLIRPEIGCKIPMLNEDGMVLQLASVLKKLADDRRHLEKLRERGMAFAREKLTYDARARALTDVMLWATKRGPKPDLRPPVRGAAL